MSGEGCDFRFLVIPKYRMTRKRDGSIAYISVPLPAKDERRVRLITVDTKHAVGFQCAILIREALEAREARERIAAQASAATEAQG